MLLTKKTCYSGGAEGADCCWGTLGKEWGYDVVHYYGGKRTPYGNTALTAEQMQEGWQRVLLANQTLKRRPEKYYELLSRNWWPVRMAETVFAIGRIYNGVVMGGTGWAVQMAIDTRTPVYVFDQDKDQWYTWDGRWTPCPEPVLTDKFAGVGTRDINARGVQAIISIYLKTVNNGS